MSGLTLSDNAIADLAQSGLTARDVGARRITEVEANATGLMGPIDGYVLPYFDIEGQLTGYYRIKSLSMNGPKYRSMKDKPNYIYFPPKLPMLLQNGTHNFMLVVEGEKKAAAAVKAGFPAVGLSGVDNWRNRNIIMPESVELKANKHQGTIQARIPSGDSNNYVMMDTGVVAQGFAELVDLLVTHSMEVIIIFDTDEGGKVKTAVQRAAATLGYEFRYRGLPISSIRQAILPAGKDTKMGVDDYLMKYQAKGLAGIIRNVRAKRIAFPRHPNPQTFVATRMQKARLSRKETQDVALSVLMELETRGRRLRNKATQDLHYFDEKTHTLMQVSLASPKVQLHETSFGAFLYREFNLSAADTRVVAWLAAQFSGEPGVDEAVTHRVLAKPNDIDNSIAYQLSDSHFIIVTPNPHQPYLICENGTHGVLFEQGHVEPINQNQLELEMSYWLHEDGSLWKQVLDGFNFGTGALRGSEEGMEKEEEEQRLEENRYLAILLYYLSPWLLRWKGLQLPVELVVGEPGSGKSSLYELRQRIITGRPRLANMTNDIRDWYAGISTTGGLYVLDNVHFTGAQKDYQQRLSDELCRLVTEPEPHVEQRKLYTNADIISLPVSCTFALTSIDQPFYTTDLLQRSTVFELSVIASGHNANWVRDQLGIGHNRIGWVAHQLAVLHKFLHRTVHEGKWDPHYRAKHRLAHYEQALIHMANVLGMPSDWIPDTLYRQTRKKMSETDWTLAGLEGFVQHVKTKYPDDYQTKRFGVKEITAWAEKHESHANNPLLTNGWKLGKYMRANKGALQKHLGLYAAGSKDNRAMYGVE